MLIPRLNLRCDVCTEMRFDEGNVRVVSCELMAKIKDVMGLDIQELILISETELMVHYEEDPKMLFRFSEDGWFSLEAELSPEEHEAFIHCRF